MPTIYAYPYEDNGNDYMLLTQRIWSSLGYKILPFNLHPRAAGTRRAERIVVLNWIEDWMLASGRPLPIAFAVLLAYILLARLWAHRLIWVRHNLKPNVRDVAPRLRAIGVRLLTRLADVVVTHRPMPGIADTAIPHPLYIASAGEADPDAPRDIPFLVFGHFRPSKAVEKLIDHWPAHLPLMLCGEPHTEDYGALLRARIAARGLDVQWDDRNIPKDELAAYLRRTQTAVIINNWQSVIVSGACYYALSYGANVLITEGDFPRFVADTIAGVTLFPGEPALPDALAAAQAIPARAVVESALATHGVAAIGAQWQAILAP